MRRVRIYQPGNYFPGDTIELHASAGQHVGVVLRMQPGEELILFCGDNREFRATIIAVHKKKVTVTIVAVETISRESPCAIHLAQAISKGDRMEWVIQKAVELGVASITPLLTAHCAVRLDSMRLEKKHTQWQAISVAACEQSGRNQLPIIHPISPLSDYLQCSTAENKFILHPNAHKRWRDYPLEAGAVSVLIGPEGGLSEHEISQAHASGFCGVSLGPRVLRTETAAIAVLSLLQGQLGDL
ncbi:MAG: 16S rRNA (uracil(1498)-N(3))-methyltransferase [Legionellaceae bacterium]|nr:16S rRNA (uracil(1498)-N(3))-methyltransferase [Legionellaceae bacterium]